jgi:DNA-binding response OmpR family regulator
MTELKKILYVEDEKDIQTIAELALKDVGGFTLEVCSSGAEAIAKCSNFKPDLILLDIMMPEMDGPTTLKKLRETADCAKTPVVFMSAKTQVTEVEEFLKLGATDFISKPFDPMTLSDQLQAIWKRYSENIA